MYHILVPYRRTGPAPNVCARSGGKTRSEKQEFWRADEWRRGIAAASALVGMSRVSAGIFIREPAPGHIESSIPRRMPADNLFVRRCLPSNVPHLRNRLTDRRRHSGFRAFFVRSIVFRHQPIRSNQRLRLFRRQPPSPAPSPRPPIAITAMFIKTGGSSGTSNSSNGCSNCYRTRIFIAGEMSRSDRALDDARRCSADRRSSELDGNVNERVHLLLYPLLPIFTSPKKYSPPLDRPFLPNSNLVERIFFLGEKRTFSRCAAPRQYTNGRLRGGASPRLRVRAGLLSGLAILRNKRERRRNKRWWNNSRRGSR